MTTGFRYWLNIYHDEGYTRDYIEAQGDCALVEGATAVHIGLVVDGLVKSSSVTTYRIDQDSMTIHWYRTGVTAPIDYQVITVCMKY